MTGRVRKIALDLSPSTVSLGHFGEAAMYRSTRKLVAAGIMVLTVTACADGNRSTSSVTAPTPIPAPAVRSTFALFGVVSEETPNGVAPLEGVMIHVAACDPNAGGGCAFDKRVTTDAQGGYVVEGVFAGAAGVWLEKPGFQLPSGVTVNGEGVQTVMIEGNTRFDIRLVRR